MAVELQQHPAQQAAALDQACTDSTEVDAPRLTSDEVLRIARTDAETAYRDLSRYSIRIVEESDGWHVDYELKDHRGGGPHYVIHPVSGDIVAKRYEQ